MSKCPISGSERRLTGDFTREASWLSHVPWFIPFFRYTPGASKYWDRMKVVGEKTAADRLALGSTHRDLYHYLTDEDGVEPVKPDKVLAVIDGQLAIIAGGDTTAITLSHVIYFLLRYPTYMERLRREVDEAFPQGEDSTLDFTKQTNMPLLNACM